MADPEQQRDVAAPLRACPKSFAPRLGATSPPILRGHTMKSDEQKRDEAEMRNAAWRALAAEQQLADLDERLGNGQGARRQRARLMRLIQDGEQLHAA